MVCGIISSLAILLLVGREEGREGEKFCSLFSDVVCGALSSLAIILQVREG